MHVHVFQCGAVLCRYSLVMGQYPIHGVLWKYLKWFFVPEINYKLEQARWTNLWNVQQMQPTTFVLWLLQIRIVCMHWITHLKVIFKLYWKIYEGWKTDKKRYRDQNERRCYSKLWWMRSHYLRHLVTLPLPAESLIIQWVVVCTNEDGLPVDKISCTLANVKHMQSSRLFCSHPLFWLWDVMTTRTQFLVEWDCSSIFQHVHLPQEIWINDHSLQMEINCDRKCMWSKYLYFQCMHIYN